LLLVQEKIKNDLNSAGVLQLGASLQLRYFSMLSSMELSFVAPAEVLKLHGITIDDDFLSNLLEHNIRLLSQGILNS
jgi:hypothetical protein